MFIITVLIIGYQQSKIEKIHQNLDSNVAIKSKGNKGEIVISFKDYEDLERILSSLADNG